MDQTSLVEEFNHYRPLLFSIAYRMVGTTMEAEDILQEAFLRWQRAPHDDVDMPKSYLSAIVTRISIDYLRSAQNRRETYIGPWLPEPILTDPSANPDKMALLSESLSMAFMVLLESLKPVERAVFLLREVFDYDYETIAQIVGKSEANCRQIVSRAKKHIAAGRPRVEAAPDRQSEIVEQFIQSMHAGDVEGILNVLDPDVTWVSDGAGAPGIARKPVQSAESVVRFTLNLARLATEDTTFKPAKFNGGPGYVIYVAGLPYAALSFEFRDNRISHIFAVVNPEKLRTIPPITPPG